MKIAICDDSVQELERMKSVLNDFAKSSDYNITYDCFENGIDLMSRITSGTTYDLIFLDIVMPMANGIEIGKEIYKRNKVTQIVFLTISPEYALDSYSVSALDYIIKPITLENFKRIIDKCSERIRISQSEEIIVHDQSSIFRIALNNLCFVEVLDHNLVYHLSNENCITCRQSLSEIEATLKRDSRFIRTHRSYVVNMDYIAKIEKDGITMIDGSVCLVSRRNFKSVSDFYLEHKFNSRGGR